MKNPTKAKPSDRNKYSLCLVEDDPEIGLWLKDKLNDNDRIYSFYWAKTFRDAVNYIDSHKPDLIILDLKLPDGNGVDVQTVINKKNHPSKVFIFTANLAFKNACLRLGATLFLDKNTDSLRLIEELQKFTPSI